MTPYHVFVLWAQIGSSANTILNSSITCRSRMHAIQVTRGPPGLQRSTTYCGRALASAPAAAQLARPLCAGAQLSCWDSYSTGAHGIRVLLCDGCNASTRTSSSHSRFGGIFCEPGSCTRQIPRHCAGVAYSSYSLQGGLPCVCIRMRFRVLREAVIVVTGRSGGELSLYRTTTACHERITPG